MVVILPAAGRPRIAWKNGGGEAEDIASGPPGADWSTMDWRVSRAWIAASGPFSAFPGIDRTFLVTEGRGVELSPAGVPARLGPDAPPFAFPGDVATGCRLLDGPVTALNVMTARGRWRHRLELRPLAGKASLAATAPATLAVLLRGEARLPGLGDRLSAADAIRLAPGEAVAVEAATGTVLAWVELWDDC